MKILVINLDCEKQRMVFQQTQMQRLNLEFERLPAIKPDDIAPHEIAKKSIQWERPMSESEIACLFSHRAAWKIVARGNEPTSIMEDDTLLSSNIPNILASLEKIKSFKHVTLEVRGRKKLLDKRSLRLNENAKLFRLYQDRTGAAAYVLWPEGARILLKKSDRKAGLADAVIASAYELSSWQIEPAAAIQLDQCKTYGLHSSLNVSSSIRSACAQKSSMKNVLSYLKFKSIRITSHLRMGLRQISKIIKAQRRFVSVEKKDFIRHMSASKL